MNNQVPRALYVVYDPGSAWSITGKTTTFTQPTNGSATNCRIDMVTGTPYAYHPLQYQVSSICAPTVGTAFAVSGISLDQTSGWSPTGYYVQTVQLAVFNLMCGPFAPLDISAGHHWLTGVDQLFVQAGTCSAEWWETIIMGSIIA